MIIVGLIKNLALLVALSVFSGFIGERCRRRSHEAVYQGLLFGGSAVVGMLDPVVLSSGVIFDGRSVLLCLCGLFFGPVSVLLAAAIAVICRVALGGDGQLMGILVIASSSALGLAFHLRLRRPRAEMSFETLVGLGVAVHVAMVLFMLCLPYAVALDALRHVALPVLLVYPVITVLMGKVLADQHARGEFLRMLHDGREEFRTALYSIGDAVVTTDGKGRVRQLNPEAERLLGVHEEDVRGQPHGTVFKIKDESTQTALESPVELVLLGKRTDGNVSGRALLTASDGSVRPIAYGGSPICDAGGTITGVVLVFRDQTAERQAQRVLQAERDNLKAVMTASPVAVMVVDGDARVVDANPAADRLFRRSCVSDGKLLCGDYLGCLNRSETGGACGATARCAACALRNGIQDVLLTKQGVYDREADYTLAVEGSAQTFCIRFSMEPVSLNGVPHVMVAMIDITDRRRAERALRESEQRYRVLADSGQCLIWTSAADKACDFINQAGMTFTGAPVEKFLGSGGSGSYIRRTVLPFSAFSAMRLIGASAIPWFSECGDATVSIGGCRIRACPAMIPKGIFWAISVIAWISRTV